MARYRLVSGLPESLAPLPRSSAPLCTPCVEGGQCAAPHSSSFPPTTAPFQTLHLDVWAPSPILGLRHERYFLVVVDDYSHYTAVFPLRRKADVPTVLEPWLLAWGGAQGLCGLRLHADRGDDVDLLELDPNVHADPEHPWDIATMTVKEALVMWKGEAVKATMNEEIRSLIGMGTWELVKCPRGVNIMKNRWVLTTKYRIDDTVEHEKAKLVVKGFTQVYSADYDEMYSPVSSYVTLRIFLIIVTVLDLNLMQLDMKNAFLQIKLDRVLYMYQPDYFDDGTGRSDLLGAGLRQRPTRRQHQHRDTEGAEGAAGGRLRVA
ncbi:unnamed protein product [Closterium sp. NIES-53]